MTAKYKVGDEVIIHAERWTRGGPPFRVKISKVGRKFFYTDGREHLRFSVEDGMHRDSHGGIQAYTPDEWDRHQELARVGADLWEWGFRPTHCDAAKMVAVHAALKPILGAS